MSRRAIEMGILEQSETVAIELFYNFFKALEVETITIGSNFQQPSEPGILIPPRTLE